MSAPIYILCPPAVHEAAMACGTYQPESLVSEGFIHASPAHQLTRVANKYYGQHAELRVLTVDPTQLTAELKWETISTGDQYPHIYGPLNMDAVTAASTVARQADGSYAISI